MQGPRKKTGGGGGKSSAEYAALDAVKDPNSARMLRMGQSVGNDELQKRIDQGSASRDELLAYLSTRLASMREAQVREESFGDEKMRSAWKEISDQHKTDVTKPEPTRYNEAAKLYELAAYQLCQGNLGRGAEIMRQAMEEEQRAFDKAAAQTGAKELAPEEDGAPAALEQVRAEQGCPPTDVPHDIEQLADKIQNNTTEFKDQPVKKRIADPWWTLEEEEEEEGEGGNAG